MIKEFDIKDWVYNTLRRASYRTNAYTEVHNAAKVPVPEGYPNKRLKFLHRCNICKQLFPMKETQVDHISPVVSVKGWSIIEVGLLKGKIDFNPIIYNLLEGKLQVLCKSCHKKKSKQENATRRVIVKMYELIRTGNQNIVDWETLVLPDLYISLGLEKLKKQKKKKK